jgi:hypothetical protein
VAESVDPAPLDYRALPPGQRRYIETPEETKSRYVRVAYRFGLFLFVFAPIAFYFGANLIMFGKWSRISGADFVVDVQRDCVPIVVAMKQYQMDHGQLPDESDLSPNYVPQNKLIRCNVFNGQFIYFGEYNELISYDFTPGAECWRIRGHFVTGTIPAPPVVLAGQSASQPSGK